MGAALVLLLVGLGAMAAGVLIGRYYVPDDRQLRRTARHGRAYMRALAHLIARDHETVIQELRGVVEENIDDIEPYFALGAMFRGRGEHERAIRVHQALAVRERDRKKLRQRAMYELGMDFRAAGMPRRATRAMEEVVVDEPGHEGALRSLAALYEEQARFAEAAELWQRLGRRRGEDLSEREHHLYVAAGQAALVRGEPDEAKRLLQLAQKVMAASAHFYVAAAELAAARGNGRGARERIKQALIAQPGLVVQLLPALTAAEAGLLAGGGGGDDDLGEGAETSPATSPLPSPSRSTTTTTTTSTSTSASALTSASASGSASASTPAVTDRVLATIGEIEQQTGPRLELSLVRAQLSSPDHFGHLSRELEERFPELLSTRVASARLALAGTDAAAQRAALEALAGENGILAWALRGRWQCTHCQQRPAAFSWRCAQCRRWGTLVMETGVEPPKPAPRERRAAPRPEALLLGAAPEETTLALPAPSLDGDELASAGARRSFLGRVGGWWRRGA